MGTICTNCTKSSKKNAKESTDSVQVSKASPSEQREPIKARWKSLHIPLDIKQGNGDGNGVMLNDHQFVWVSNVYGDDDDYKAIHKYNVYKNEWCPFIDYPKDLKIYGHSVAFNEETNKLYSLGCGTGMIIVDINTNIFQYDFSGTIVSKACLINVDGIIHKIGGWYHPKHSVWNDDENVFEQICDFEELGSKFYGASIIYVPSRKIILLIGGRDDDHNKMVGIWKYYLVSNKWQKISGLIFDYYYHAAVLSLNEEYVVIAGGFDEYRNRVDIIHVLDIRNEDKFILRECSLKIPLTGHHIMFRSVVSGGSKDVLLISGWIKSLFKLPQFDGLDLPPLEIMELITLFYFKESIHLIRFVDDGNNGVIERFHFVINIKHILSSLL